MSPIIDTQRRLSEAGRIRPGATVRTGTTRKDGKPATRPVKLDAWRFTSRNLKALEAVAGLYGGEVKRWEDAPTDDQFELFTEAAEIDVVLPPERISFSQWMEAWTAGGCAHRCDGITDEITNSPCSCDPEKPECTPHTRLSLMLAGIPTTGLFRVETQGHYAKAELAGAMELAELLTATTGRSVLPAKLCLEHRKVVRDGKTRQFVVPVIDFQVDVAALATGAPVIPAAAPASLPPASSALQPGLTPIRQAAPPPPLADQLAAVEDVPPARRRANSPPPIPATGLAPRTAAAAESGEAPSSGAERPTLEEVAPVRRRRSRRDAPVPAGDAPRLTEARARELVEVVTEFFPNREERLRAASNVLERELTSFSDLTPQEGNQVARWAHDMREF